MGLAGGRSRGVSRRQLLAGVSACLLTAGCGGRAPDIFDLNAPVSFASSARSGAHLVVMEPRALSALNTERVVVREANGQISYFAGIQWSDRLTGLVQSRIVQAFENSGRIRSIGQQGDGLKSDYILVTDIRRFEFFAGPEFAGRVTLSVKIVNDSNGRVVSSRVFDAEQPAGDNSGQAAVASLDAAFDTALQDIVAWTLRTI
ncbi:MAG: ABC-type transport auxiliary lipoprotein family protein [Hyphomicrobiales bacterium]|nr:ABC-type transport auxiliary lipoprotein family protein [Hyphomicrobiales bacterium]